MILFLDTALGATTIAIKKDNKIFKKVINDNINISQHLVSCVNDILKSANSKKTDIKLLCFNKGPGNFTSLRVSLAFIKAIAYYLNVPVLELNSFQVLAISTLEINYNSPFVVAVDAKMNEVYFSEYKNFVKYINLERYWANIQAYKIFYLTNLDKKETVDINKYTNVLAYFIIRCEIYNDFKGFIKLFGKNVCNNSKVYFEFLSLYCILKRGGIAKNNLLLSIIGLIYL